MNNYENLDWIEVLNKIQSFASSQKAKLNINNTKPFQDQESALLQIEEIYESLSLVTLDYRPNLDSIDLFDSWFERLEKKSYLKTNDFQEIRKFCYDIHNLKKLISNSISPWTKSIGQQLLDTIKIISAIDQIITVDGNIRTDASEDLHRLYNEKKSLEKNIRTTLDKFVKDNEMGSLLQDKYVTNREGRWVLPIKSGRQHQFDGIIHDSSQSKQTVFMEPQVILTTNNRLKEVESEIENEIEKILKELGLYISSYCKDLKNSYNILLKCDERFAQAQFSIQINGSKFEFSDKEFLLKGAHHPLLSFQNSHEIIKNDIYFEDQKKILILSGPNAGGKTVLLKAIGLSCHMARCGLLIPTQPNSKIPFFKNIIIAIGDTQSVGENLSTFAAHLKMLTRALKVSGKDQLILIDEICGSTDPEEGAALARSFIEKYAENGVYAFITSHLGPLKQIWPKESPITCGSMEYNNHPTYRLFMGIHGRSFALKMAKTAGVPEEIINKSLQYLSPESRRHEEKLSDLEKYKEKAIELSKKLEIETNLMERLKNKYKNLVKSMELEKKKYIEKALERAEIKIEKIIDDFRSNPDLKKIKVELPKIIKSTGKNSLPKSIEEFSKSFPPGTAIFISSLKRYGIIQSLPNSKGEVTVMSNSMRLQVSWQEIEPDSRKEDSLSYRKQILTKKTTPTDEIEIDLRGMTSDQAIDEIEKKFDQALQDQVDRVKIIHGHGSGALKKFVRQYLSRSIYVQKWQAGSETSNDDGFTWADLS